MAKLQVRASEFQNDIVHNLKLNEDPRSPDNGTYQTADLEVTVTRSKRAPDSIYLVVKSPVAYIGSIKINKEEGKQLISNLSYHCSLMPNPELLD